MKIFVLVPALSLSLAVAAHARARPMGAEEIASVIASQVFPAESADCLRAARAAAAAPRPPDAATMARLRRVSAGLARVMRDMAVAKIWLR